MNQKERVNIITHRCLVALESVQALMRLMNFANAQTILWRVLGIGQRIVEIKPCKNTPPQTLVQCIAMLTCMRTYLFYQLHLHLCRYLTRLGMTARQVHDVTSYCIAAVGDSPPQYN
jgi:hypothetical protein